MKIGLCGAQGTGKTTLARALARELGLPLIAEQARLVAREMGIENPRALKGNPELGRRFQWLMRGMSVRAWVTVGGSVEVRVEQVLRVVQQLSGVSGVRGC